MAGLVLAGIVIALVAPACSNSPGEISASMTSDVRPTAPTDESPAPDEPTGNELIPGTGDPGGQFGDLAAGLGDLGDCAELGLAYSQLVVIAFTSDDPGAEIDAVIDELKGKVPAELQDQLQTVADTLADAGDGGILDATGAMSDPAFRSANEAITNWISSQCTGG